MQARKIHWNNVSIYDLAVQKKGRTKQTTKTSGKAPAVAPTENNDLIQDFNFPVSCSKIQITGDKQFVIGTGMYKPQIRYFDLYNMTMKHYQITDYETIDFRLVSDDWSKIVTLYRDRYIDFHVKTQCLHRLRIPREGRCLDLIKPTASLYAGSSANSIYKMNLDRGQFDTEIVLDGDGVNCLAHATHLPLLVAAVDDGTVACVDTRLNQVVATKEVGQDVLRRGVTANHGIIGCSSVTVREGRNEIAVGTSEGQVLVYDLRASKNGPLAMADHRRDLPIHTVRYRTNGDLTSVVSSDKTQVRVWKLENDLKVHAAIIPADTTINSFEIFPDSGLIFTPMDREDMGVYYIPDLGPVPEWCPALEATLEEMDKAADKDQSYDGMTFVTAKDLTNLGLKDVLTEDMLKPTMGGFYVETRLYKGALAAINPLTDDMLAQRQSEKRVKGLRDRILVRETKEVQVQKKKHETEEDVEARRSRMAELLAGFSSDSEDDEQMPVKRKAVEREEKSEEEYSEEDDE